MSGFIRGRAVVLMQGDDGEWRELGEPVSMTVRREDGSALPGTCPECAVLPFNGNVVVCEHGVTT